MGVLSKVLNQCRKPTGRFGRLLLRDFNRHHSKLTDWGLTHVSIGKNYTILDVGCGGGLTVHKLAAIATEGKVYGIDYSEESVAVSRRTNQQWIEMGRVEIRHASVSQLPFTDAMFDLVTAVETTIFWPDLPADMREVLRVLKPGGKFIFIIEAFKDGALDKRFQKLADLMQISYPTVQEHRELLFKAGYADAQMFEQNDKGWMCGVGTKAA
jgi:ubiquinone/menaquinone biosynthesis C-methylase UbiE